MCIKIIFKDLNFNSYPHTSSTCAYKVLSNLISASNLLKYKRKRKKKGKFLVTGIKVFFVYTLFCFFENFLFLWREYFSGNLLEINQITVYTFCVQEKRKKDYFLVVASYKVPLILLFDRLKSCIQNRDKSSWSVTHNHKTSNPCESILKFLTFSSDHSRGAGYGHWVNTE